MTDSALDSLRVRLGLTWGELADRIGVSDQTLRRIRSGKSRGLPIVQRKFAELQERSSIVRADDV